MNNRSPILAIVLVSVVGVYALVSVVRSFYLDPRTQLLKDIAAQETLQDKLEREQAGLSSVRRAWQTQTSRTLSDDPQAAQDRFRDDITALAKKHSLVGGHTIGERNALENKKGSQKGFIELPITFTCTGTLKDLEGFLLELYQKPYYVSVDKLNLTPSPVDQGLTGSKKKDAPASPNGPELRITMDVATLVLPTLPQVKSVTYLQQTAAPATSTNPSTTQVSQPVTRPIESPPKYLLEDVPEYAMITRANLFKPYKEPPRVVVDTPVQTQPARTEVVPRPPPPAPPDTRVVLGTTGMDGHPIVFVREEADKLNPPTELRLNEAVSDDGRGHLVLIHPKGIVIRVKPKDANQPPKNYFVALGTMFKDRVELSGSAQLEYPDVYYQLSRVLTQ